jgi:hypothetical protein
MLLYKKKKKARHWWLTSVILAIQEAEIRRIMVRSQPIRTVLKTLPQKITNTKEAGGMAQGVGPEFKPQYCRKKNVEMK